MKDRLQKIRNEAIAQIKAAGGMDALNDIRVSFLGKKGELTAIMKSMRDIPPEERPAFGQMVNEARQEIENSLDTMKKDLAAKARELQLKSEVIDVTLPAKKNHLGHRHPNSIAQEEVERIFTGMGYEVVEGPEIEFDYYNFEALNIPANHPAKDEQDTFYITKDLLLRTQTSGTQIHTMETQPLPIRMIAPGRVFRADELDATHSPNFHQIEGLVVDKNVTFFNCGGKGCRRCKGEGWIEILGCGMVHPHVFEMCGIDPEEYQGFAFGVGLERIAMLKYEIDDMHHLYENDIRFLKQF